MNAHPGRSSGVITEIIDAAGDGSGSELSGLVGIAVDSLTVNVYVIGEISNNAFKITPGGIVTEIIDATGDGAGKVVNSPESVHVDVVGNVYIAGRLSNNAFKVTSAGVITEIIDATGDGAGNGLDFPNGITSDAQGNAYVAGAASNNAFKFTPAGAITEIIDATGDGTGKTLSGASAVAVDAFGTVYVAGSGSDNAFKIQFHLFVDNDATGANDGTSWSDAYTTLQDALADAAGAIDDQLPEKSIPFLQPEQRQQRGRLRGDDDFKFGPFYRRGPVGVRRRTVAPVHGSAERSLCLRR